MISNTLTTMSSSIREKPFCFRMSPPKATPNPPSAGRPCRPVWNLNSTKSERWDLVHDSRHTKIRKSRASILYFAVRRPGCANLSTVREYRVSIKAEKDARKYRSEFTLKSEVDPESAKAEYKNGILDLLFLIKDKTNKGYRRVSVV